MRKQARNRNDSPGTKSRDVVRPFPFNLFFLERTLLPSSATTVVLLVQIVSATFRGSQLASNLITSKLLRRGLALLVARCTRRIMRQSVCFSSSAGQQPTLGTEITARTGPVPKAKSLDTDSELGPETALFAGPVSSVAKPPPQDSKRTPSCRGGNTREDIARSPIS